MQDTIYFENGVITTNMKSPGTNFLTHQSITHVQQFLVLDKSTGLFFSIHETTSFQTLKIVDGPKEI